MSAKMLSRQWKTIDGKKIKDIRSEIKMALTDPGKTVFVGSDSQQFGKFTRYVTVLVIRTPGKGGRVLYCHEKIPRVKDLRERLWREAWASVMLAMELTETSEYGDPVLPKEIELEVHIDANSSEKEKSSKYVQELVGLVVGQGFKTVIKPNSWAATYTADHVVKYKLVS